MLSGREEQFGVTNEERLDGIVAEGLDVAGKTADGVGATFGVREVGGERSRSRHAVTLDLTGGALPEERRHSDLVDEDFGGAALQPRVWSARRGCGADPTRDLVGRSAERPCRPGFSA